MEQQLGGSRVASSMSIAIAVLLGWPGVVSGQFADAESAPGISGDGSYRMVATWTGMMGVQDILLTQGAGSQLFILFNTGGTDLSPRGRVLSFARQLPTGTPTPIPGIDFRVMFSPIALASAGNRVFVLDAGDSCLAKADPATPSICDPTYLGDSRRITNLNATWRVREYGLLGGDTLSTFTDTTFVSPQGIAADAQGNVYVSGTTVILVPDPNDPRILTRQFQFRVYRYKRGPRYPGIVPPDRRMPGANWHRDTTWVVEQGSDVGTLVDPRGLYWSAAGGNALYAADFGKNWVQKLSDTQPSTGFYAIDGGLTGLTFNGPIDVAVDTDGFLYLCDTGNKRVLRYNGAPIYEPQVVNVEVDAFGDALHNPVAVAADDSLVYVAERDLGRVIRYQRRRGITKTPLTYNIHVLQNPYLSQYLDVFVVPSQLIDNTGVHATVGTDTMSMALNDAAANVWKGDYKITSSGMLSLQVCATSTFGSSACSTRVIAAQLVGPGSGLRVTSPRGDARVVAAKGSFTERGYVTVIPLEHADASVLSAFQLGPATLLADTDLHVAFAAPSGHDPEHLVIEQEGVGELQTLIDSEAAEVWAFARGAGTFHLRSSDVALARQADDAFIRFFPNAPNPFTGSTVLSFELHATQDIRLHVYDLSGRRVKTLADGRFHAGRTSIRWDARSDAGQLVPSGVYYVRIETSARRITRAITVLE